MSRCPSALSPIVWARSSSTSSPPVAMSAFDGMQSQRWAAPPTMSLSTSVTSAPRVAATVAHVLPAGPPPRITTLGMPRNGRAAVPAVGSWSPPRNLIAMSQLRHDPLSGRDVIVAAGRGGATDDVRLVGDRRRPAPASARSAPAPSRRRRRRSRASATASPTSRAGRSARSRTSTPSSMPTRSWCCRPTTVRSPTSPTAKRPRCSPCCATACTHTSRRVTCTASRSSTTCARPARRSRTRTRRCSRSSRCPGSRRRGRHA